MPEKPVFIFVSCQVGMEKAVKAELAVSHPTLNPAFARPGFLTFKVTGDHPLDEKFELRSALARTYGFSLGKLTGDDPEALAAKVWPLAGDAAYSHLHVWQRDARPVGDRGYEPSLTPEAAAIGASIQALRPQAAPIATSGDAPAEAARPIKVNHIAGRGAKVLDVVMVEPGEWWIGWHRATSLVQRWPGGIFPQEMPEHAVSRAYMKMVEALEWSQLPVKRGETCAELGSAPGGSCQALLDRGLIVVGIDPAEMKQSVLEHPNFLHIRRRSQDVPRGDLVDVRWLAADLNVPPNYTLDSVESIVKHPEIHIRGLLLTLKLPEVEMTKELPKFLARIRSWGFKFIRARQLPHNKQELCVAALKNRAIRRERHLRGKAAGKRPLKTATKTRTKSPPKDEGE